MLLRRTFLNLASPRLLLRDSLQINSPRLVSQRRQSAPTNLCTRHIHSTAVAMFSSAATEPSQAPPSASASNKPEPSSTAEQPKLPPLNPTEFRAYNNMAEHMELFHNHFRQTWTLLWNACTSNKRPASLSLKSFLNEGLQFIRHLTAHHNIEETYIFPVLAKKMPEFKNGKGNGAAELLHQHREIHKGMDVLEAYLRSCVTGETELELAVLKTKMESWGDVLWTHLDQEVKTLGAENMRKYWTLEEMRRMPM